MMYRLLRSLLALAFIGIAALAFAHETTGWKTPEEAKKLKNPMKATDASIQKGKEIYEKNCARCHGINGDGKGAMAARLNPKPTNFREHQEMDMTDGELFWKITTGRGSMLSYKKSLTEEERWDVVNYINTFSKRK